MCVFMINDSNKGSRKCIKNHSIYLYYFFVSLKKFIAIQFRFALGATSINSFYFSHLFHIFFRQKEDRKKWKMKFLLFSCGCNVSFAWKVSSWYKLLMPHYVVFIWRWWWLFCCILKQFIYSVIHKRERME